MTHQATMYYTHSPFFSYLPALAPNRTFLALRPNPIPRQNPSLLCATPNLGSTHTIYMSIQIKHALPALPTLYTSQYKSNTLYHAQPLNSFRQNSPALLYGRTVSNPYFSSLLAKPKFRDFLHYVLLTLNHTVSGS